MLKRSHLLIPLVGSAALAFALPAAALQGVAGAAATAAQTPSFSDLVLVQFPPPKGPVPKAAPKGPAPKGPIVKLPPKGPIVKLPPKGPIVKLPPKGPPKGVPPPPPKGPPPPGQGVRYIWGGLPFVFYEGYYYGDCSWLRRKARETGSAYWWSRYRKCRDDD